MNSIRRLLGIATCIVQGRGNLKWTLLKHWTHFYESDNTPQEFHSNAIKQMLHIKKRTLCFPMEDLLTNSKSILPYISFKKKQESYQGYPADQLRKGNCFPITTQHFHRSRELFCNLTLHAGKLGSSKTCSTQCQAQSVWRQSICDASEPILSASWSESNLSDPDSPPPGTCIALLLAKCCLGQHNRKATAGTEDLCGG